MAVPGYVSDFSTTLPGAGYKFSNLYQAPGQTSGQSFQDLLASINSASGSYGDLLKSTLSNIDLNTNQALASSSQDMFSRGLIGSGQNSDIAQNSLAQILAGGVQSKANAEGQIGLPQAQALEGAYGQAYGTAVNRDTQATNIASQGALSDVSNLNSLLGTQYGAGVTAGQTEANQGFDWRKLLQGENFTAGQNAAQRELDQYLQLLKGRSNEPDFWTGLGETALTKFTGSLASKLGGW